MQKLVWYWMGGQEIMNFGEHFVELILSKLGVEVLSFEKELEAGRIKQYNKCGMVIGSELHGRMVGHILEHVPRLWVWGQGNGRPLEYGNLDKYMDRIDFYALRGPLTKRKLGIKGNIPLCDPGFLMPKFYPLEATKTGEILYVPHHSNRLGDWNVLIPRTRILQSMSELVQSMFVLTNSLHVFIFCLAYKVPCSVYLRENDKLDMPDKWQDVMESMDTELFISKDPSEGIDWWKTKGNKLVPPDTTQLLEAFTHA